MKKSKFTEQQIAFALLQAETGTKVKEIVRQMGITSGPSTGGSESSAAWVRRSRDGGLRTGRLVPAET